MWYMISRNGVPPGDHTYIPDVCETDDAEYVINVTRPPRPVEPGVPLHIDSHGRVVEHSPSFTTYLFARGVDNIFRLKDGA